MLCDKQSAYVFSFIRENLCNSWIKILSTNGTNGHEWGSLRIVQSEVSSLFRDLPCVPWAASFQSLCIICENLCNSWIKILSTNGTNGHEWGSLRIVQSEVSSLFRDLPCAPWAASFQSLCIICENLCNSWIKIFPTNGTNGHE
jgi:hypothetical protein